MKTTKRDKAIRLAVAGVGNCASSLIEGISFYRQHPEDERGLLFPSLGGYSIRDIDVVAAFDISSAKVGRPLRDAILARDEPAHFLLRLGFGVRDQLVIEPPR